MRGTSRGPHTSPPEFGATPETIVAEWDQAFANTAGFKSRPGMITGQAITHAHMHLVDLGDPDTLAIRDHRTRHKNLDSEYLVDRARATVNLPALQSGRLPYYLIQISALTPVEAVHQIVGSYGGEFKSCAGYDLEDHQSVWGVDILSLTDEQNPIRIRTIDSPSNPELVHVISEGHWSPRVFAGSKTALIELGVLQFEKVLVRCRREAS